MAKAKVPMKRVAVLDDNNVLTGSTTATDGVDFGDLPTDGSYKYDETSKTFIPVGHGFGKVKTRQPYETRFGSRQSDRCGCRCKRVGPVRRDRMAQMVRNRNASSPRRIVQPSSLTGTGRHVATRLQYRQCAGRNGPG